MSHFPDTVPLAEMGTKHGKVACIDIEEILAPCGTEARLETLNLA